MDFMWNPRSKSKKKKLKMNFKKYLAPEVILGTGHGKGVGKKKFKI